MGETEIREAAAKLRESHRRDVAEIRANADLTDDAKERQVRALADEAQQKMENLRTRAEAAQENEREELRRSLVRPTYPYDATASAACRSSSPTRATWTAASPPTARSS